MGQRDAGSRPSKEEEALDHPAPPPYFPPAPASSGNDRHEADLGTPAVPERPGRGAEQLGAYDVQVSPALSKRLGKAFGTELRQLPAVYKVLRERALAGEAWAVKLYLQHFDKNARARFRDELDFEKTQYDMNKEGQLPFAEALEVVEANLGLRMADLERAMFIIEKLPGEVLTAVAEGRPVIAVPEEPEPEDEPEPQQPEGEEPE